MRLAIVGSRDISDPEILLKALKTIPNVFHITEIVSGGAKGVDTLAREYAQANNLPLTEFLPDYERFGRGATLKRNSEIIEYADIVLAIPVKGGSAGTHDSIRKAKEKGKRLFIFEVPKPATDTISGKKTSLKVEAETNPYEVGERVLHKSFGEGVVKEIDGINIKVEFEAIALKTISSKFQGITKIQ